MIVFGETFTTLTSSKSHKSRDIDMKFYPRKKSFILKLGIFFLEALNKKSLYFFCNKNKAELFLDNRRHNFVDIDKNFTKAKFQTNHIGFRTVEVPRSFEGITKLDTIQEEFL